MKFWIAVYMFPNSDCSRGWGWVEEELTFFIPVVVIILYDNIEEENRFQKFWKSLIVYENFIIYANVL